MGAFSRSVRRAAVAGVVLAALLGQNAQAAEPNGVQMDPRDLAASLLQTPEDQWKERMTALETKQPGILKGIEAKIPEQKDQLLDAARIALHNEYMKETGLGEQIERRKALDEVNEERLQARVKIGDQTAPALLADLKKSDAADESARETDLTNLKAAHDADLVLAPHFKKLRAGANVMDEVGQLKGEFQARADGITKALEDILSHLPTPAGSPNPS